MKFTLLNSTIIIILVILFANSCSSNNSANSDGASPANNSNQTVNENSESADSSKDDLVELEKIIKLPLMPDEANYWEDNSSKPDPDNQNSAPSEKRLIVVLKFSPENSVRLVSEIEKIKLPVDAAIDADRRFPAELVAQSQLSGDETLKGKSYAADDFLLPPYKSGKITRIENSDYFVLELSTN